MIHHSSNGPGSAHRYLSSGAAPVLKERQSANATPPSLFHTSASASTVPRRTFSLKSDRNYAERAATRALMGDPTSTAPPAPEALGNAAVFSSVFRSSPEVSLDGTVNTVFTFEQCLWLCGYFSARAGTPGTFSWDQLAAAFNEQFLKDWSRKKLESSCRLYQRYVEPAYEEDGIESPLPVLSEYDGSFQTIVIDDDEYMQDTGLVDFSDWSMGEDGTGSRFESGLMKGLVGRSPSSAHEGTDALHDSSDGGVTPRNRTRRLRGRQPERRQTIHNTRRHLSENGRIHRLENRRRNRSEGGRRHRSENGDTTDASAHRAYPFSNHNYTTEQVNWLFDYRDKHGTRMATKDWIPAAALFNSTFKQGRTSKALSQCLTRAEASGTRPCPSKPVVYTPEQLEWIKNYVVRNVIGPGLNAWVPAAELFNSKFKQNRSAHALYECFKRNLSSVAQHVKQKQAVNRVYTEEELEWLKTNIPSLIKIGGRAEWIEVEGRFTEEMGVFRSGASIRMQWWRMMKPTYKRGRRTNRTAPDSPEKAQESTEVSPPTSKPITRSRSRPNIRERSRPNTRGRSRPNTRNRSRPNTRNLSRPTTRGRSKPTTRGRRRATIVESTSDGDESDQVMQDNDEPNAQTDNDQAPTRISGKYFTPEQLEWLKDYTRRNPIGKGTKDWIPATAKFNAKFHETRTVAALYRWRMRSGIPISSVQATDDDAASDSDSDADAEGGKRVGKAFSNPQIRWLQDYAKRHTIRRGKKDWGPIAARFNARFNEARTADALYRCSMRKGISIAEEYPPPNRNFYTDEEISWLRENVPAFGGEGRFDWVAVEAKYRQDLGIKRTAGSLRTQWWRTNHR